MNDNCVLIIAEVINAIATLGAAIIGALITGVFILGAAFLAYSGGLRTYFKKREHEQIMKRYLDEGIDRALVCINQALTVFIDNHRKASTTLRQVEKGQKVDTPVRFQSFDRHILELAPYHKVTCLVGDQIFGNFIAAILGLVDGQSNYLEKNFQQLHYIITQKGRQATLSPDLTVVEVKEYLDDVYKKVEKCFVLLDELQQLISILEKQKTLSWPDLSQFKNLPEVKQSVERLKKLYAELEGSTLKPD